MRICCIRSFGHFAARLQGSILQFSPEMGIFVSTGPSEQETLLQQAQAQFRMVSPARCHRSDSLRTILGPGSQDSRQTDRRRLRAASHLTQCGCFPLWYTVPAGCPG